MERRDAFNFFFSFALKHNVIVIEYRRKNDFSLELDITERGGIHTVHTARQIPTGTSNSRCLCQRVRFGGQANFVVFSCFTIL